MPTVHVPRRWIHAACAVLAGVLLGTAAAVLASTQAQDQAAPDATQEAPSGSNGGTDTFGQPIAFSHQHHAGEYGIDCQFCHVYARRGPVAGIPSVQRCVGCHRTIVNDRPEIQTLLEYWENEEPIPWVRMHDLPDYVRFTHKAHVRAGVDCASCHGDVQQMDIAQQVEPLTMGWCLDCHKARQATRDCLACHY